VSVANEAPFRSCPNPKVLQGVAILAALFQQAVETVRDGAATPHC
jgi:hypothetical protein